MQGPETRASLIVSQGEPASEEAWTEFAAIYRPLIVRVATAKGLQHADVGDLAQETMAIVGRSVGSFDPNSLGRFARFEVMEILGRGGMGSMGHWSDIGAGAIARNVSVQYVEF